MRLREVFSVSYLYQFFNARRLIYAIVVMSVSAPRSRCDITGKSTGTSLISRWVVARKFSAVRS